MANKTHNILDHFARLSTIPRCSGNEAGVCAWLQEVASKNGFDFKVDEAGNIVIQVPGTQGYENSPTVVLQGHMDMVCEKTPESTHDFSRDAIKNIVEGDWLHGDNTTLGADNGIAIALALAVALDPQTAHPPLELLFTVKEEVGLSGVNFLKPGFIAGQTLINLDSEDEGTFIVGCAGGETTILTVPLNFTEPSPNKSWRISVSGCRGGHSGVDIDKNFANANKLLARALYQVNQQTPIQIISVSGGTAHNAIPRGAEAVIGFSSEKENEVKTIIFHLEKTFQVEYAKIETGIRLEIVSAIPAASLSAQNSSRLIALLNAIPHGVANMSSSIPGFVETSNNLARIEVNENILKVVTSQRSTSQSKLREITQRIYALSQLAGGVVTTESAYPPWQPNMNSKVLGVTKHSYRSLFGTEPDIKMIHAGLECSSIGDIYTGIDMISIGATIENPHSPTERMFIPSIEKVWDLLVETLKNLK